MDNTDVKDILDIERGPATPQLSKESIMGTLKEPKKLRKIEPLRRPTGMNREVYALLYSDANSSAPSLIPTDTGCGYRQPKARLGRKHVRPWKWMLFTNPARQDNLQLSHWRRTADEGKEYPFARFNKKLDIPTFTEDEYQSCLTDSSWNKDETEHLFDLCRRFDLRFVIVHDRYDTSRYQRRSIEDLKERYYSVCNRLSRTRNPSIEDDKLIAFDGPHETKRKLQLERLLTRTKEQVEEEELLVAELKKIEMRKKERERKQADLQKLISAAEQNAEKKGQKKANPKKIKTTAGLTPKPPSETAMIFKTYDKSSGVTLRSSKTKFPLTLGQRKTKAIEQLLEELGVDIRPMPTEQICLLFNELRNDIMLLLDLKAACDACEFELQSLKHRYEELPLDKQSSISLPDISSPSAKKLGGTVQIMDVVSQASQMQRKRRPTITEPAIKKRRTFM